MVITPEVIIFVNIIVRLDFLEVLLLLLLLFFYFFLFAVLQ